MALNPAGKAALVTGGASGICREFVKTLLAKGCNVLVADLKPHPDDSDLPSDAKHAFVQTDVTDWAQLQNAFEQCMTQFGRLDIVCPGAGVLDPAFSNFWNYNKGVDTNKSSSFKVLDINLTHPIRATQLAIDAFERQKLGHGVVVCVSSIAAQGSFLVAPLYCASKHGVSGFVRSLADLEPKRNYRINAVAPGCVKTAIWTPEKVGWLDEEADTWVPVEKVAQTMLELVTDPKNVGGLFSKLAWTGSDRCSRSMTQALKAGDTLYRICLKL
ncbi:hypothetical protein N7470_007857 [Penicillium chermesinum]|nr:hypothetical protein N7470_007857 [Penicillium chermesinum]